MIEARGAALIYRDHGREVAACRDLDVTIAPGEFVGILGPSGSGKSSLLYLLSGLKQPSHGEVRYEGKVVSAMPDGERANLRLRDFGFVFQQPYLLGYLTALENVALAGGPGGSAGGSDPGSLLENLGLGDKLHRYPHELSGGERQRVCVARALFGEPKVIFADEPTAALDHRNGVQVVELLNRHRGRGALVMVTHDPSMLEHADRTLRIEDGAVVDEIAHS